MSVRAPFEAVRTIGKSLAGVEESTSYGTPSLKVRGNLIARLKEDGQTLALRTDLFTRDLLLEADPRVFFVTDHYRDHPWVLVRLREIAPGRLRELLETSYRMLAPKKLLASVTETPRSGRRPARPRRSPKRPTLRRRKARPAR